MSFTRSQLFRSISKASSFDLSFKRLTTNFSNFDENKRCALSSGSRALFAAAIETATCAVPNKPEPSSESSKNSRHSMGGGSNLTFFLSVLVIDWKTAKTQNH